MIIRDDVRVYGLRPEALLALMVAKDVCLTLGYTLLMTSIMEGTHMPKSLHLVGQAFDFWITQQVHPIATVGHRIQSALRQALTPDYDVVYEGSTRTQGAHIHCEYQPKESYT